MNLQLILIAYHTHGFISIPRIHYNTIVPTLQYHGFISIPRIHFNTTVLPTFQYHRTNVSIPHTNVSIPPYQRFNTIMPSFHSFLETCRSIIKYCKRLFLDMDTSLSTLALSTHVLNQVLTEWVIEGATCNIMYCWEF
jgi:hypothetical protein